MMISDVGILYFTSVAQYFLTLHFSSRMHEAFAPGFLNEFEVNLAPSCYVM